MWGDMAPAFNCSRVIPFVVTYKDLAINKQHAPCSFYEKKKKYRCESTKKRLTNECGSMH